MASFNLKSAKNLFKTRFANSKKKKRKDNPEPKKSSNPKPRKKTSSPY